MYEELIQTNNELAELLKKEKAEKKKLLTKQNTLLEFAKSFEYINPRHFKRLEEELQRIEEE